MGKINGGRLAVKALKNEGAGCVFAISGGHVEPLFQGCLDEKLKLIDVRHEQAAALAAEGWARVTGQPGICVGTAGPGVTNLVTGVWNAFECQVPMIAFGGKAPLREFDLGAHQELDSITLMKSMTKWQKTCYETKRIPEYVSIAYRQALSGRPGPVYLEIPQDIFMSEVEEGEVVFPKNYRTTARPQGDPAMVKKAVDMLLNAKKPVVVAGSGIWWSRAEKELKELIELLKLPLILIQMARGAVPEDHPLCFGPTRVGTKDADVILLIGTRLNYGLNFGRPGLFGTEGKWIQVDIEPEEIGRNRPIDVGITGDAKAVLSQMIAEAQSKAKGRKELPWIEECKAYVKGRQQALEVEMNSDSVPIHPARVCKEIRDFIDRDAIIVMDGGDTTVWGAAVLKAYEPGQWLDNGPTGSLGVGIPYAMAAKVAKPNKQLILLHGDGSFGLNAMEFDTMVRYNIPVVCVIANDEAWGMTMHVQQGWGEDRVIGTRLGFRPYEKMIEGLGGYGEAVEKPEGIRPALQRAFASGKPAVINVKCASLARAARRRPTTK
ncbi:MAG: thiamine pyrophosphate-binding protein [Chloroflexota bacterium]